MSGYVQIAEDEGTGPVELPTEENNTLLMSTLQIEYSGASLLSGLKYRNPATKIIRLVLLIDGQFYPPADADGWGSHVYWCVFPKDGLNSSVGRWDRFITLLKQSIDRPKKEVLDIIAERYYNAVDAAARSETGALNFYNLIKNLPSTSTKVFLQDKLNLHINGPVSLTRPNILYAIDVNMDQFVIKLLRITHDLRYDRQQKEILQEKVTCSTLSLNSPQVALCPVEIISIEYEERRYVALKMPRFLNTLQDVPRVFPEAILYHGRRLAEAVKYIHAHEGNCSYGHKSGQYFH